MKTLKPGDFVFWNDPDEGECSRLIEIKKITYLADSAVLIEDVDGSSIGAFLSELEKPLDD